VQAEQVVRCPAKCSGLLAPLGKKPVAVFDSQSAAPTWSGQARSNVAKMPA
jgi:hypothetical protein